MNAENGAVNTVLPLTSANTNSVALLSFTSGDFATQTTIDQANPIDHRGEEVRWRERVEK